MLMFTDEYYSQQANRHDDNPISIHIVSNKSKV